MAKARDHYGDHLQQSNQIRSIVTNTICVQTSYCRCWKSGTVRPCAALFAVDCTCILMSCASCKVPFRSLSSCCMANQEVSVTGNSTFCFCNVVQRQQQFCLTSVTHRNLQQHMLCVQFPQCNGQHVKHNKETGDNCAYLCFFGSDLQQHNAPVLLVAIAYLPSEVLVMHVPPPYRAAGACMPRS